MSATIARANDTLIPYEEDEYLPESDGKPMAETDLHLDYMIYLLHALREYFRNDQMVYVTGNIFMYYLDEANIRQSISPDIMVFSGIEKKERRIYKVDDEGKAPDVVIELISTSTKLEDKVTKPLVYAYLGVREYYLFDPFGDTIGSGLQGYLLEGGNYAPRVLDAESSLYSEKLGLRLKVENGWLRLYDPKTGNRLKAPKEVEEELRAVLAKIEQESQARQTAEAKAAKELKARQTAEAKAAKELKARQAAEAEVARLRADLAKMQSKF
jgi:Uma2 family endonuclease